MGPSPALSPAQTLLAVNQRLSIESSPRAGDSLGCSGDHPGRVMTSSPRRDILRCLETASVRPRTRGSRRDPAWQTTNTTIHAQALRWAGRISPNLPFEILAHHAVDFWLCGEDLPL